MQVGDYKALEFAECRKYRTLRKDLLAFLSVFITNFEEDHLFFFNKYSPVIGQLVDYYSEERNEVREPETLKMVTSIVHILGD